MNNKKPRLRVWLLKMQRVEQQNLLRADQKRRQMMRLRLTMVKLHVLLQRHWQRNKRQMLLLRNRLLMLLPRNKLRRLRKQLVSKRIVSPRKPRLLVYNLLRTNKRPHVLLPRKQPELLLKMKLIELLRK